VNNIKPARRSVLNTGILILRPYTTAMQPVCCGKYVFFHKNSRKTAKNIKKS